MLNESDIKAALFSKLLSNVDYEKNLIINEMVINNRERRADFVLINNSLNVYEIKSDLDSLKRLEGQVECYLERFDKVTLVVTERHLTKALDAPSNVAIWKVFENKAGAVKFKEIRRGVKEDKKNISVLCDFLTKKELQKLMSQICPEKFKRSFTKSELFNAMPKCCSVKIKKEVVSILREKHKKTFLGFVDVYGFESVCSKDISNFSRSKQRLLEIEKKLTKFEEKKTPNRKRSINFSKLLGEASATENTPPHILIP